MKCLDFSSNSGLKVISGQGNSDVRYSNNCSPPLQHLKTKQLHLPSQISLPSAPASEATQHQPMRPDHVHTIMQITSHSPSLSPSPMQLGPIHTPPSSDGLQAAALTSPVTIAPTVSTVALPSNQQLQGDGASLQHQRELTGSVENSSSAGTIAVGVEEGGEGGGYPRPQFISRGELIANKIPEHGK